jgi:MraZ protein
MDNKGRIALPSKLRPSTGDKKSKDEFILTKGLDGCLALYPEEQWQLIQQRLGSLNFTRKDFRYFGRVLHSVAVKINLDRQGRLLIPSHLQEDAGLNREVLVIGVHKWIECWAPEKYQQYLDQYDQSYEEVAEKLFDLNRGEEN